MPLNMFKLGLVLILATTFATPAEGREPDCNPDGVCVDPQFQRFWSANGGLPVFGYALDGAAPETSGDSGQPLLTQWTERTRLEWHPELTNTPYAVLLGRLGVERLTQQGRLPEAPVAAQKDCRYFPETGHNVCNQDGDSGFLRYWQEHGLIDLDGDAAAQSLALFGLPLTEVNIETNCSGDRVATQWFERARFEWHPANPAGQQVLLGLLGSEVRHQQLCAAEPEPWPGPPLPPCPDFPQAIRCIPPGPPTPDERLQEPAS